MLRSLRKTGGTVLSTLSTDSICCVSVAGSDRLRLVGGPDGLRGALESALKKSGICLMEGAKEHSRNGFEWRLLGNPWNGNGVFAVAARYLFALIISEFFHEGYAPFCTADASRSLDERGTVFFRERTGNNLDNMLNFASLNKATEGATIVAADATRALPLPPRFWCLVLYKSDKIRTIGAGDRDVACVREGILQFKAIQRERTVMAPINQCHQFKLKGNPWSATSVKSAVKARLVLLGIFETLLESGCTVVATVDPANSSASPGDCFIMMTRVREGDDEDSDAAGDMPYLYRARSRPERVAMRQ